MAKVTKQGLADLIVSGMDLYDIMMATPRNQRGNLAFAATRENVAGYLARKHTLAELTARLDELTRPARPLTVREILKL